MEEFVGKYAKVKLGLFSGLIGRIERETDDLDVALGLSPYKLVFPSGLETSLISMRNIEILDEEVLG